MSGKKNSPHANRTTFKPGQSGNPSGRPKMDPEIKEALGRLTPKAVALLEKFIKDEEAPHNVRLNAAIHVLDRNFGRCVQTTELTGKDGGDIHITDPAAAKAKLHGLIVRALTEMSQKGK